MSDGSNIIWNGIKRIFAALVRIILFIIAWSFKLFSRVLDKVGDEILKFSGK